MAAGQARLSNSKARPELVALSARLSQLRRRADRLHRQLRRPDTDQRASTDWQACRTRWLKPPASWTRLRKCLSGPRMIWRSIRRARLAALVWPCTDRHYCSAAPAGIRPRFGGRGENAFGRL